VWDQPRLYLEAWIASLAVTAVALGLGPFAPWGLFWSYIVILHLFVEILAQWDAPEVHRRFARSRLFPVGAGGLP